jgi:hypothetical protein
VLSNCEVLFNCDCCQLCEEEVPAASSFSECVRQADCLHACSKHTGARDTHTRRPAQHTHSRYQ